MDSHGLNRDSQPQASVTEQPGCVHSAGPGKPDAGGQTWNYSDDQHDGRERRTESGRQGCRAQSLAPVDGGRGGGAQGARTRASGQGSQPGGWRGVPGPGESRSHAAGGGGPWGRGVSRTAGVGGPWGRGDRKSVV